MPEEIQTIDDFLNHSPGGRGDGGRYLKSWTKDGSIRIWLHTRRLPIASWRHSVPTFISFKDRRTGDDKVVFWGREKNCWEDEDFLKGQYYRDEEGNLDRVGAPRKCGVCRLIDVVYKLVARGKLDWAAPVFKFEGATDERDDVTIHAGGLAGMFGSNKLTDQQVNYLKSKGIFQSEAWRENFHAKLAYVFAVVDHDNPADGVQIAPQTQLVGAEVRRVIKDAQKSLGDEEGNPMLNPFCIELSYDKRAPINQRYRAVKIDKIRMTPEVEALIKGDPPNLRPAVRPHNQKELRAMLQRYAVVDLPWDEIYDVPQLVAPDDDAEFNPSEIEKAARPDNRDRAVPVAPPAGTRRQVKEESRPDVNTIPCDKCRAPMREDEVECKECGARYELVPDPPKQPGKIHGDKPPFGKFA